MLVLQFHETLHWVMSKFSDRTDNNPLGRILTSRHTTADMGKLADLSDFNYIIEYRSGKSNAAADASIIMVWAFLQMYVVAKITSEALDCSEYITVEDINSDASCLSQSLSLQELQDENPHISSQRNLISMIEKPKPSDMKSLSTLVRRMTKHWDQYNCECCIV